MKKRIVTLYVLSFCLQALLAQVQIPHKCYMHITGSFNDSLPATAELIKIDDSLYASLTIKLQGIPAGLYGKITPGNLFWLARDYSDGTSVMTGRFVTGRVLTGKTDLVDGTIPGEGFFEMTEDYPEGSIPMQVFYKKEKKTLIPKTSSPLASITQCLVVPALSSSPVISDTLRKLMMDRFANRECIHKDPDEVLESVKNMFFTNYTSSNADIYSQFPDSPVLNWELLKYTQILFNEKNILSFGVLNYAFTGGAHGMETRDFTVFDIQTGKPVGLTEIFREGFEKDITDLLTRTLKSNLGIGLSQKLTDNGFFVDEVKPNENFYLTASGIGFFYNHYEIAPYSNGPNEIFLPYSMLAQLLKPASPVNRLIR